MYGIEDELLKLMVEEFFLKQLLHYFLQNSSIRSRIYTIQQLRRSGRNQAV